MIPIWLILSLLTVILLGMSGIISKYALKGVKSEVLVFGSFLVIFPMSAFLLGSFILLNGLEGIDFGYLLIAFASALLANLGFFLYFDALEKGPLTIIGSITSAYPGLIVLAAILFLGETVTFIQGSGILLIMVGIILLVYLHGSDEKKSNYPKIALLLGLLAFLCWSVWGILLKIALNEIEVVLYLGLSAIAMPLLTVSYMKIRKGKIGLSIPWKLTAPFAFAVISIEVEQIGYFSETYSVASGPASLVFPIVASYPIIMVLLAYVLLKERMSRMEWLFISLVLLGLVLVAVI